MTRPHRALTRERIRLRETSKTGQFLPDPKLKGFSGGEDFVSSTLESDSEAYIRLDLNETGMVGICIGNADACYANSKKADRHVDRGLLRGERVD